jgi:hypothetical protein
MPRSVARILLGLSAVLFAAFGAAFAVAPAWMAAQVDIVVTSPTGRADLAAIYGGLELGLGAYLALCLWKGRLRTGLTVAALALSGLALVRGVHLLAHGGATAVWAALGAEAVGAALALWGTRTAVDA